MNAINQSAIYQPDFKKKKVENCDPTEQIVETKQRQKSAERSLNEARIPMVNKEAKEKLKLEEENRRLTV